MRHKEFDLKSISENFRFEGDWITGNLYGDGHINDTFKLEYLIAGNKHSYILQRINHIVFKDPKKLMKNIEGVTDYLGDMLRDEDDNNNYSVLEIIRTTDDKSYYQDLEGNYWRAYVFVENAMGHTLAEDNNILYNAARAFGKFQSMLKDYPAHTLDETIADFHNTKQRFTNFQLAVKENPMDRVKDVQEEIEFVFNRKSITSTICDALDSGKIPLRVTHNDTKINNVLIDNDTGEGRCVIDLDTVMPGSALYDYGDAIRSCASTGAEDEIDLQKVSIDLERFRTFTKGYLEELASDLIQEEIELLPTSAIIMTFECGMRFLTDYIQGDTYFRIHREHHNLDRARNQFKYIEDMEQHFNEMKKIVLECLEN